MIVILDGNAPTAPVHTYQGAAVEAGGHCKPAFFCFPMLFFITISE
jgi:hypothetical protein